MAIALAITMHIVYIAPFQTFMQKNIRLCRIGHRRRHVYSANAVYSRHDTSQNKILTMQSKLSQDLLPLSDILSAV